MASNTGKAPSPSSSKAPAVKQTPPVKNPAAAKTRSSIPLTMVKCNHCRLEYHSEGQLPTDEYHAMERISTVRDLHIKFEDGEIEMTQKKAGHWCQRTFLKEHISWDYHKVPSGQTRGNRFLHIGLHVQPGSPVSMVTFRSTVADAQEQARGIEQAKDYPLANLPANILRLRLLLGDLGEYWTLPPGVPLDNSLEVRGSQIKRIMTRAPSVNPASPGARKLDSDIQYRKQEVKVEKKQTSDVEGYKIEVCYIPGRGDICRGDKPAHDSDKIDESPSGASPATAAAAAPMPEAGFAPVDPRAYINPSTFTRHDDVARRATGRLKVWAKQQGLERKDEGPVAQTGSPTEQPRQESSEVKGKGSGNDSMEEQRAELELQLVRLEQSRTERQRQLWDRFKIDEYNLETSKVNQEYYQQKTDLQQQFLEALRRRV